MESDQKPWYKQARFIVPIAAAATIAAFSAGSASPTTTEPTYVPVPVVQKQTDVNFVVQPFNTKDTSSLSNNDSYICRWQSNSIANLCS